MLEAGKLQFGRPPLQWFNVRLEENEDVETPEGTLWDCLKA